MTKEYLDFYARQWAFGVVLLRERRRDDAFRPDGPQPVSPCGGGGEHYARCRAREPRARRGEHAHSPHGGSAWSRVAGAQPRWRDADASRPHAVAARAHDPRPGRTVARGSRRLRGWTRGP